MPPAAVSMPPKVPGQVDVPFSRLLHALQNCGHFIPFSIFPASLATFHSAAHFFCRSRAAICPGVGVRLGFGVTTVLEPGAGVDDCASAGHGAAIIPASNVAKATRKTGVAMEAVVSVVRIDLNI